MKNRTSVKNKSLANLISVVTILVLSLSASFSQTTVSYTTPGANTWVCPVGVTQATVATWGGGGGGSTRTTYGQGGGGGGGAYSSSTINVTPGTTYYINVGSGGGPPNAGGVSWLNASTTTPYTSSNTAPTGTSSGILASGGTGVANNTTTGGAGGLASTSYGTTKFDGGTGGTAATPNSGGGGGGAGSTGIGGNGGAPTAGTGTANNGGNGGTGVTGNVGGNPGNIYGGGGSGASRSSNTRLGGTGAQGYVTVTYTVVASNCPVSTSVTPTGAQTLCQGEASNLLTANITTSGGSGTPTLLYQWYYNTTNSNTVSGASLLSGATSQTYSPLTTAAQIGNRWYFCVGYATNNGCAQTNATQSLASNAVQVTVNAPPTTANAGSPQTICNGSGATLGANTPTVGTGAWSVVSGPSTSSAQFNSTSNPAAIFTPAGGVGNYVLRWTISNAPCTSSASDVTITVKTVPALPVIAGSATVTSGNNYVYNITPVADATNYTWAWPATWNIVSGQGTASITVTAGTGNGNITVYVTNSCGNSPTATYAVTVSAGNCPASTSVAPATAQTHCQGNPANQLTATVTLSGGTGTPTLSYQWYYNTSNSNIIAGATTVSGATNATYTPLTTIAELGTRYYFCVGYATDNGCGQTNATQSLASNTVQVTVITTPVTPGAISGAANVSPNSSGLTYSISSVPTATSYNWTVPTGWTINSGQGTTSISVTSGNEGQNGNISVTASNSCGTSAASTLAVTVTTAVVPPTITLGANPTVCQGNTSASLPYTSTTESPNQYSIDYSATANAAGFADVVNATLPASPISLVVPGAVPAGTYSGNLSVRNSTSGLSSGNYAISVTVITTPAQPGTIFGNATVPASTLGLSYGIAAVQYATTYTWTVPTGWIITSGQGTSGIVVTSGTAGQNGNITVTAGNSCGTSAASTLVVTSVTPTNHSLYGCNACHIIHNSPGGSLTSTFGNANLCISCHTSGASASGKPFTNANKAIPGTSGNSHAWDKPSVNGTFETVLTSDPQMVLRVDAGNIVCSTCHDQHNSNTNPNYTRISNSGDAMCKDCHSPRNVGKYSANPSVNKGSHPVGLTYPASSAYKPTPTGTVTLPGGQIECSSCHMTHYSTSTDGYLLRQAVNDNTLCTSCHTYGTHNGMGCKTCHQTHNTNKSNIYMIKNTITTPNSGDKSVVFTALTGTNSFADGNATYNGVCEVCHTTTTYHKNNGTGTSHNAGQNCTGCHPHSSNFTPSGGNCIDCHVTTYPKFATDGHVSHTNLFVDSKYYNFDCSTCHFGNTHNNGTINVAFNPDGLARRNGLDSNTPTWDGTTCSNVYCHSTGNTADRGTDGTQTWGSAYPGNMVYHAIPSWNTGVINSCGNETAGNTNGCHFGPSYLTSPYTTTRPGTALTAANFPSSGKHISSAHQSNSQNFSATPYLTPFWASVQCFWCHDTDGITINNAKKQGTYGTSFHVDGQTHFKPKWYSNGGTMANDLSYSSEPDPPTVNAQHCGAGKTCW